MEQFEMDLKKMIEKNNNDCSTKSEQTNKTPITPIIPIKKMSRGMAIRQHGQPYKKFATYKDYKATNEYKNYENTNYYKTIYNLKTT